MIVKKNFRDLLIKYNIKYKTTYSIKSMSYPTLRIEKPITKKSISSCTIFYNRVGKVFTDNLNCFLKNNVLQSEIGDLDFDKFISFLLTLNTKEELVIEIWPPEKIKYAYLKANYFSSAGQLGSSCMRDKGMQRSLNFYEKQGVQIIVVTNNNKKIYARALLWDKVKIKGDKHNKVYTYMDRVYSSGDQGKMFRELATENKWLVYPTTSQGDGSSDYYITDINIDGITHLPWSDTFRYLYFKDKIITGGHEPPNLKFPKSRVICSHTTDRGYHRELDPNSVQEVLSGKWVSKKDCIKVKQYNGYVSKGNIIKINNIIYSKLDKKLENTVLDGYIFKPNIVKEHITGDTMDKNNGVEIPHYPTLVHKKNIIKANHILYHKKDKDIIQYKKKYYHATQCLKTISQQLIPKHVALSIYRLKETLDREIKYEQDYCYNDYTGFVDLIITETRILRNGSYYYYNTITPLVIESATRGLIKKHNGKFYLKEQYKVTDKAQGLFDFMKNVEMTLIIDGIQIE